MRFKNKHRDRIEISITGWDSAEELLIIRVKGSESGLCWEGIDPCLTLQEGIAIAKWFESVKDNEKSEMTFIEPELEFSYYHGKLDIYLEWELRPPWKPSDVDSPERYSLCFDITAAELIKQANSWKTEIERLTKQKY